MKTADSKRKWIGRGFVILLILYAYNYAFTPYIIGVTKLEAHFRPTGNLHFDSRIWKSAIPAGGERYEMVDDLLRRGGLFERTENEIKGLLGKPDIATSSDDGTVEMHYTLASQKTYPARSFLFPRRFGNSELWTLVIRLREGRVNCVKVIAS
jgi:hypothetical protein